MTLRKNIFLFALSLTFVLGLLWPPTMAQAATGNCSMNLQTGTGGSVSGEITLSISNPDENSQLPASYRLTLTNTQTNQQVVGTTLSLSQFTQEIGNSLYVFRPNYASLLPAPGNYRLSLTGQAAEGVLPVSCSTTLRYLDDNERIGGRPDDSNSLVNSGDAMVTEVTESDLLMLNPLSIGKSTEFDPNKLTPASLLNRVITFAFPLAGLILFVMLLWSGFEMVSGATNKKSQDAGRQRATAAVIGFILLFVSYWIIRLLEIVFGARIF